MHFSDEELKNMTMSSLNKSLRNIYNSYDKIYDMYYSENCDRDVYFIHDLVDALKGIEAVLEVYTRDNYIHPSYALEKLKNGKSYFDCIIEFYESELNKND